MFGPNPWFGTSRPHEAWYLALWFTFQKNQRVPSQDMGAYFLKGPSKMVVVTVSLQNLQKDRSFLKDESLPPNTPVLPMLRPPPQPLFPPPPFPPPRACNRLGRWLGGPCPGPQLKAARRHARGEGGGECLAAPKKAHGDDLGKAETAGINKDQIQGDCSGS